MENAAWLPIENRSWLSLPAPFYSKLHRCQNWDAIRFARNTENDGVSVGVAEGVGETVGVKVNVGVRVLVGENVDAVVDVGVGNGVD